MSVRIFRRLLFPSFKTNHKTFPPTFFSTFSSPNQLMKQIFAYETTLFDSKTLKNYSSVASFRKNHGSSNTLLSKVEKNVPQTVSSKLEETIEVKINIFKNFGLSDAQIATVVSTDPQILYHVSSYNIERSVSTLKKVLGNELYNSRILRNFRWFLNYDLDKTLVPNVEFMKSCGIEQSQIMQFFYNFPLFLRCKLEKFKEFVRRVDEMGIERKSKTFVYAVRTIGSMSLESWEQKLDLFRGLGFTEAEIISTFKKSPVVFATSKRKIKETTEFLLSSEKFGRPFIIRYPFVFLFSLDQRLKPRIRVLEILDREKILKFNPISTVFTMSDLKFFDKFVRPHLDNVKELSFVVNEVEGMKCLKC